MQRLVLVGLVVAIASPVAADNWPAWRGDGSGVSGESGLPERWGSDLNVVWKTPIEGDGISSPIVWGDRIFLTTASQATGAVLSHLVVYGIGGGLLLLAMVALGAHWKRRQGRTRGASGEPEPAPLRRIRLLDRLATAVAFLVLVSGLVAVLVEPELVSTGSINRAWLVTGILGAAGLITAVGLQSPVSRWRPVGAALLAAAAVAYYLAVPDTRGSNPIEPHELLASSLPLVVAAAWSVLLFVVWRRLRGPASQSLAQGIAGLALVLLVALQFAFLNYLRGGIEFRRSVVAIDRSSGEVLWQRTVFVAPRGPKYHSNSFATPTPVTDGRHVVADFGLGLASLDFDGDIVWKLAEPQYFEFARYGASDSPVMWRDVVVYAYVPEYQGEEAGFGYSANAHLTAVDKATGETRWTTVPREARDAYNTPLLTRIGGRDALLLLTNKLVLAFDVETGEEIWRCRVDITQGVPSLVADDEHVFAIGGTHGPRSAVAIRLAGRGDITEDNVLWSVNQGIPEVSSPVLYQGRLYMVTNAGIATCLDATDGSRLWRQRLPGSYQASPVAGDGKVYFTSMEGTTVVIRAGAEYEEIARNDLGEEVMASPAISDGQIFVRTRSSLYCIRSG
jgi:outer membrane protein assembly factor BamB